MENESMEGRFVWNTREEGEEIENEVPIPMTPEGDEIMTEIEAESMTEIEIVVATGTTKGKRLEI
jgi:hypothetical protein